MIMKIWEKGWTSPSLRLLVCRIGRVHAWQSADPKVVPLVHITAFAPDRGDDLLDVIHQLSDKVERVMLFGHNPELTELAHRLAGEITHMPTCAVAELTFDAKSWSNIGKIKPAKVALDYPKKS